VKKKSHSEGKRYGKGEREEVQEAAKEQNTTGQNKIKPARKNRLKGLKLRKINPKKGGKDWTSAEKYKMSQNHGILIASR